MNPSVLVALANLQRRRRRDTAPRAPFADVGRARRALAEDGVAIAVLSQDDLPALTRLADAVSGLAECVALRRPPASRAVDVINELASGCTGTVQLIMGTRAVQSDMSWHDPDPVAGLARRVIEELDGIDLSRLRQCQRKECDLLFFDMTRSRSQRWHAENPCGWLERQHRRRGGLPHQASSGHGEPLVLPRRPRDPCATRRILRPLDQAELQWDIVRIESFGQRRKQGKLQNYHRPFELPESWSGDLDRPVADASDDIDGAAEGLNVPADGVHLGDLAVLDLGDPRLCDAIRAATCAWVSPAFFRSWFRTGDIVSFTSAPCRCGRTSIRMHDVHGRLDDMLIIKAVNIFPSDVEALVRGDDRHTGEYRLVVDRFEHLDRLTVELERTHTSSEFDHDLAERFGRRLKALTGVSASVTILAPGSLPRATHKAKRVEDRRTDLWA
jgi:hypothetical protein